MGMVFALLKVTLVHSNLWRLFLNFTGSDLLRFDTCIFHYL